MRPRRVPASEPPGSSQRNQGVAPSSACTCGSDQEAHLPLGPGFSMHTQGLESLATGRRSASCLLPSLEVRYGEVSVQTLQSLGCSPPQG